MLKYLQYFYVKGSLFMLKIALGEAIRLVLDGMIALVG